MFILCYDLFFLESIVLSEVQAVSYFQLLKQYIYIYFFVANLT